MPYINGVWSDFISDFLQFTEGAISPPPFRLWSGISLLAGALERRVWSMIGEGTSGELVTFPNLYVILVAPPGVGKFIIEKVRNLWNETPQFNNSSAPAFKVAPDSVTKASLMDRLARAKQTFLPPEGPPITYHSLLVAAEEFQVLLPDYDREFIGALNSIFNNKNRHEEARRTGTVKELLLEYPQLNILGGAQPSYLATTFPEEFWATGLSRRMIMIYAPETPLFDIFNPPPMEEGFKDYLLRKLSQISVLYGQMKWRTDAAEFVRQWHLTGGLPKPEHSKLVHYVPSRTMFVIKLSVISAISRTCELVIEKIDCLRAMEWLFEAERVMPDIFRVMIGKSDAQVMDELYYYLMAEWGRSKQKPISSELIWAFLGQRLPSDKPEKVFVLAERSGIISRVAGTQDLWVPRPRHQHGME